MYVSQKLVIHTTKLLMNNQSNENMSRKVPVLKKEKKKILKTILKAFMEKANRITRI
jgi:hypothetical protein